MAGAGRPEIRRGGLGTPPSRVRHYAGGGRATLSLFGVSVISSYLRPAHAAPCQPPPLPLARSSSAQAAFYQPLGSQLCVMNTSDVSTSSMLSPAQVHYLSTARPVYYSPRAHLVDWLPDHLLALAVPVIAYWISSIFFHILDISEWKWLDKYRIHESAEVKSRNLVTRAQVIRAVILQQIVQTIIGFFWMEKKLSGELVDHVGNMQRLEPMIARLLSWTVGEKMGARILDHDGALVLYTVYWWAIPTAKFLFGMCVAIHCHPSQDFPLRLILAAQVRYRHMAVFPPPCDAHEPLALQAVSLRAPPAIRPLRVRRVVQPPGGGSRPRHGWHRRCGAPIVHDNARGHAALPRLEPQDSRRSLRIQPTFRPASTYHEQQRRLP